ncbi:MAG: hypothetical protein ACJ71Q_16035 [Terriglobales bacterium]
MNDYSFAYRSGYLYRMRAMSGFARPPLLLVIALSLLCLCAGAQSKKPGGPRAIGVVTWNGDDPTPTPSASVLTPVAILVDGRYYDAELYQAQPQPLAIDSGVVYSVLKSGEEIGTFNLAAARERDGIWYGTGFFDLKTAKTAKPTAPAPAKSAAAPEEDRPRLRRGPAPPPPPKAQTDAVLSSIDRDPERPTLRHHTPEEQQAKKQASGPQKEFVPPAMHMLVAVSDAGGPEPRSFAFHAKAGELDQLQSAMEKLARAELEKQRKTPQPTASKTTATRAHSHAATHGPAHTPTHAQPPRPTIQLQNPKFGAFDVNYDNAPIVIYSATANVDGAKKYITVGAWQEIDGSMRKVFAQTTDDQHLDVYPRLEVIDAVDASGNGRGELLFRAYGDQGSRFVLYHPGPDSLNLLFDSARGESDR